MSNPKHHLNDEQRFVIDFIKENQFSAELKTFFQQQNEREGTIRSQTLLSDFSKLFNPQDPWISAPHANFFKRQCELFAESKKLQSSGIIYYFESSNSGIGKAKILWDKENNFTSAKLIYLDELNADKHIFRMEMLRTHEEPPFTTMYYMARCEEPEFKDQINFFTLKAKGKDLNAISSIFVDYSVLETENKILSTGIGLWYNSPDIELEVKNDAPGWVIYALYDTKSAIKKNDWRHDFIKKRSNHRFFEEAPQGFKRYQAVSQQLLDSEYHLIYITRNISNGPEKKGGLGVAKLSIFSSKLCILEYLGHDNRNKRYNGIVKACDDNGYKLQILMERDDYNNYNRQIFIKKDRGVFYGVYVLLVDNAPVVALCTLIPSTNANLTIKRYSLDDIRRDPVLQNFWDYLKEKSLSMDYTTVLFSD